MLLADTNTMTRGQEWNLQINIVTYTDLCSIQCIPTVDSSLETFHLVSDKLYATRPIYPRMFSKYFSINQPILRIHTCLFIIQDLCRNHNLKVYRRFDSSNGNLPYISQVSVTFFLWHM